MNETQTVSAELHSLGNLMKRRGEKSRFCRYRRATRLTDMQTRIIGFLYDHRCEDIFQKNIEQAFSMRRPSVSILIQEMEAKQLVVRESVPYDARLKKVVLTEKSLCLANGAERELRQLEEMLTEGIPSEDLAAFFRVTARIRENIERSLGSDPLAPEKGGNGK
ncbi:MAG: MarR family winged helix-turn-helix transcriptional regulator [Bacillota bacterium]|jgi:MarR family transcriptional repressor of mepA